MKRGIILAAGIALLTACGHQTEQVNDTAPAVPLTTARERQITETVDATGRVGATAGGQTKVSFIVPGVIRSVYVRVGEHVSTGEALAQLDASGLSLAAQQAQAAAQAAAANAQQAAVDRTSTKIAVDEAALQRAESLYSAGVTAHKDIETARAQLAADRADARSNVAALHSANAQLHGAAAAASIAQRDLANGTLRAPVDGVVAAILHREGEAVDSTTPVVAIGPLTENTVTLDVPASEAARVRPGDPAHLAVFGSPLQADGTVSGVSTALDPATQTATILVTGAPSGALAGASVQATIQIAVARGLVLPQTAIVQDPQTGETLVFVQSRDAQGNAKFAQRPVHVAFNNGTDALISSGLRAGERVASQGAFELLSGQQ